MLTATSATPIVAVQLDVTQEYLVKPGDTVSVVLPDGTSTVAGHIQTVGNVATCPGGGGTGRATPPAAARPTNPRAHRAGRGNILDAHGDGHHPLDRTPPGARLDQAPVNVNITSQTGRERAGGAGQRPAGPARAAGTAWTW